MKHERELSVLPKWPSLDISEEGGWTHVYGEHDTHTRLKVAEVIRFLVFVFCLFSGFYYLASDNPVGLAIVLPLAAFSLYPKSSLIICTKLFPKETNVVFEQDTITINGKSYAISPEIDAQFRSGVKQLDERQEQRIRSKDTRGRMSAMTLHKVGYRKVEMIYGGNVVPIAIVSDQDKAAQFVYVLQEAWQMSRMLQPEEAKPVQNDIVE